MLRLLATPLNETRRLLPALWFLLPLAFGFLSLIVGQDANWDLQNYHLYNPYALLTGRIGTDLAPAGMQSYFNPLLDVPYYWMAMNLPPMLVAAIMGTFHGLNFLLLHGLVRRVVPADTGKLAVLLLALSGCLGASFISELGNTMGDNSTALLVLGGLLLIARHWSRIGRGGVRAGLICVAAGLAVGLGVGLKLTNAPYAVGMFMALALIGRPSARRLAVCLAFGSGVLAGMAITAGYWFALMWEHFGNPLFPQFNAIFKSEFAQEITLADTRWLPGNMWETIFFPFVFTLWPHRFGEVAMIQLLWPGVYTLFGAWLVRSAYRRRMPSGAMCTPIEVPVADITRFMLIFLVASYGVWMAVFSIGRYAIVMEMLLPVTAWVILHRLTSVSRARRVAAWLIGCAVALSLLRFDTWGNAGFAQESFSVDVPPVAQPENSVVLVLASPMAWILPHFPPALAFVSLGSFPESPGYWQRAQAIIDGRTAGLYAIVPAVRDARAQSIQRLSDWLDGHGVQNGDRACSAVAFAMRRMPRLQLAVPVQPDGALGESPCAFELPPAHRRDVGAENRQIAKTVSESIRHRGLSLLLETCTVRSAHIGSKEHVFQFCSAARSPHGPP
ncbi:hypothetical protein D8B23_02115 [Verminephrobacter aporrectodeae subsp. tuberculatae]|uniref:hypothetical protein n=1 Tax=Verminephrobacter aporrectodeae TaxID=1110389 RepID=UPI002243504F|nr:hypothetical protein [Verminephrobacter aporrectodeae]MCW8197241.1 hypothetical protein [Verminephrobacter aporrectodeae subsp. tuberculatae]